jgi:hypothetical protein
MLMMALTLQVGQTLGDTPLLRQLKLDDWGVGAICSDND